MNERTAVIFILLGFLCILAIASVIAIGMFVSNRKPKQKKTKRTEPEQTELPLTEDENVDTDVSLTKLLNNYKKATEQDFYTVSKETRNKVFEEEKKLHQHGKELRELIDAYYSLAAIVGSSSHFSEKDQSKAKKFMQRERNYMNELQPVFNNYLNFCGLKIKTKNCTIEIKTNYSVKRDDVEVDFDKYYKSSTYFSSTGLDSVEKCINYANDCIKCINQIIDTDIARLKKELVIFMRKELNINETKNN